MTSRNLTEIPDRSTVSKYLSVCLNKNVKINLTSLELFGNMKNAVMNNSETNPLYRVIQNIGDERVEFGYLKMCKD